MNYFDGHEIRDCGEHQTVGPHRAWCFECSEWCYPQIELGCKGCTIPFLRAEIERVTSERDALAQVQAGTPVFTDERQLQLDRCELARARVSYEVFRWAAQKQSAEETLSAIETILTEAVDADDAQLERPT